MTIEIISLSVSMKVWDRARIDLANPGSAVRLASVARHVTDCAMRPGNATLVMYGQILMSCQPTTKGEEDILFLSGSCPCWSQCWFDTFAVTLAEKVQIIETC